MHKAPRTVAHPLALWPRASRDGAHPHWKAARSSLRGHARDCACRQESLAPSEVGRPHRVEQTPFEFLVRSALAAHAHAPNGSAVWRDGNDELLVVPGQARVATQVRHVFVQIPVYCEQSGHTAVTVIFACNAAEEPLGLVLATESAPRGPRIVVERWAEPLIACAYAAVLEAASSVVEGAPGEQLLLVGLGADACGVVVVMQRDPADATPNAPHAPPTDEPPPSSSRKRHR